MLAPGLRRGLTALPGQVSNCGRSGRSKPAASLCATLFLAAVCYLYTADPIATPEKAQCLIVFLAAAASSIAGFAFSPIAGAALFQCVDAVHGIQIMLVSSVTIQLYSVIKLRQTIKLSTLTPFLAGGCLGLIPGLYLLLNTPSQIYALALGVFLVGYGLLMLGRRTSKLEFDNWLVRFCMGALGGLTGATAAFPGAFVTIWCSMRGWTKAEQRAIYQPFILIMQIATLALLGIARPSHGDKASAELLLYIVPAIAGTHLGLRIFRSLSQSQFDRVVNLFLIVSGVALTFKS
jgi:uncharacterized protein